MPDLWSQSQVARALRDYPLAGPVLDIGAGAFAGWFAPLVIANGLDYVGLDQEPHEGIDILATAGSDDRLDRQYPTILLLSVLEHTPTPQRVMDWTIEHLAPGGHLLVAVPICWPEHDYPGDYWRILPDGLLYLLRNLTLMELTFENGRDFERRNQMFAVAVKGHR